MDNLLREALLAGAKGLGVALAPEALDAFGVYLDELVRWNRKLNLTAVDDPPAVVDKHFVDSLAVAPWVGDSLLDVGTGAGFPGMAIKIARPAVRVVLVDGSSKKISFLKALLARLGTAGAEARAMRAEGHPEAERLGTFATVISRAVEGPREWLPRAAPYLAPGGRVIAMLGKPLPEAELAEAGGAAGLALERVVRYRLPRSGAERALAIYRAAA